MLSKDAIWLRHRTILVSLLKEMSSISFSMQTFLFPSTYHMFLPKSMSVPFHSLMFFSHFVSPELSHSSNIYDGSTVANKRRV